MSPKDLSNEWADLALQPGASALAHCMRRTADTIDYANIGLTLMRRAKTGRIRTETRTLRRTRAWSAALSDGDFLASRYWFSKTSIIKLYEISKSRAALNAARNHLCAGGIDTGPQPL